MSNSLVTPTLFRLRREAELEHFGWWACFVAKFVSSYPSVPVKSLLIEDGESFIFGVYKKLLKRSADSDGLSYYSLALDSGKLNKLEMILDIINSAEGKKANTHVTGLFFRKVANRIFRSRI